MGTLFNLTKEYFDVDSIRLESRMFNEDDLNPVDIGCSVLWADKDLVKKYGKPYYDKYFSFDEIGNTRFRLGWRMPTLEDYIELFRKSDIIRKRKMGEKKVEFTNKITNNVLVFENVGLYHSIQDTITDSFSRLTSEIYEEHNDCKEPYKFIFVFDVSWGNKKIKDEIIRRQNLHFVRNDVHFLPVRLVKDK